MPTVDLGNVVGPQGPQGATGPQGPQGIQGETGPNAVSASTATNLNGVLAGNGSNVTVRAVDTTPTSGSGALLTSGGAYDALQTMVRPNLLDNAYFVGGGSQQGGGQFPVNRRGQTRYTVNGNAIDRWTCGFVTGDYIELVPDGVKIVSMNDYGAPGISQKFNNAGNLSGKTVTFSAISKAHIGQDPVGFLQIKIDNVPTVSSAFNNSGLQTLTFTFPDNITSIEFDIAVYNMSSAVITAAKLELGPTQTIAHKENGAWTLNEIPSFQEQLFRCQTSTADPSDTYANKTNVVDNYYSRPNLLDNAYFVGGGSQQGDGKFPINQRAGYLVPPNTPIYNDTDCTDLYDFVGLYTKILYVNETYGEVTLDGTIGAHKYVKRSDMVTGYFGAGYGIDRWLLTHDQARMTLNSDSVTFGFTRNGIGIAQVFGNELPTGTYTISVLVKNISGSMWCFPRTTTGDWSHGLLIKNGLNTLTIEGYAPNGFFVYCHESGFADIQAVKLELGDTQTLAHQDANGNWVLNKIPDYDDELRNCQRYQFFPEPSYSPNVMVAISTSVLVGSIYFPVIMRTAPNITILRIIDLVTGNLVPLDGTAFTMSRNNQGIQSIRGGGIANLTVGRSYSVSYYADSNL